jgi:hypothetical protein
MKVIPVHGHVHRAAKWSQTANGRNDTSESGSQFHSTRRNPHESQTKRIGMAFQDFLGNPPKGPVQRGGIE